VYSGPCKALWSSLWFIAAVGIVSMCVINSRTSALPLRAIIDPAWIEVIQCGGPCLLVPIPIPRC